MKDSLGTCTAGEVQVPTQVKNNITTAVSRMFFASTRPSELNDAHFLFAAYTACT